MRKHTIILVAMLVFALTTKAQTLLGIPFDGSAKVFANALVQKGFTLKPNVSSVKNVYILKGSILSRTFDVYVFGSAKTNTIYKMVAYSSRESNFSDLTSTYNYFYSLIEGKYGKSEHDCIDYFKVPYERGDGYEMTAVSTGKYVRMCLFGNKVPNLLVSMTIEKYAQVKIAWENTSNLEIHKSELSQSAKDEL